MLWSPAPRQALLCVVLRILWGGWHFSWLVSLGLILHGASSVARDAGHASSCQHAWKLPPMDSDIPPYPWPPKYDYIILFQNGPKFVKEGRQAGPCTRVSLLYPAFIHSGQLCLESKKDVLFMILSWDLVEKAMMIGGMGINKCVCLISI